jgi:hypothetical protein
VYASHPGCIIIEYGGQDVLYDVCMRADDRPLTVQDRFVVHNAAPNGDASVYRVADNQQYTLYNRRPLP